MQQSCTYGSVRGALGNQRPYRDKSGLLKPALVLSDFLGTVRVRFTYRDLPEKPHFRAFGHTSPRALRRLNCQGQ